MKLEFKVNDKPFKETTAYNVLFILLCLVRLFICLPVLLLVGIYVPIVALLGVKQSGDKAIKLFENFVFNQE